MKLDPDMQSTRNFLNKLAKALDNILKLKGFALLVFDLNAPKAGRMNWVSSAQRETMITALKEMVAQLEGRVQDGGGTQ